MTGRPKNTGKAFWGKVNQQDARFCWNWIGSLRNGYGNYSENKRSMYAHRYAWSYYNGPIPDGMVIMHKCNNKRCCNPLHLELGTDAENTQDAYRDGLIAIRKGESHHRARLTEEAVLAIYSDGRTYTQIAAAFGIAMTTVSSIKNGYTWSHVTGVHK